MREYILNYKNRNVFSDKKEKIDFAQRYLEDTAYRV